MRTLLITVFITVLLLGAGVAVVARMPATQVTASKYILHIEPSPAVSAQSATAVRSDSGASPFEQPANPFDQPDPTGGSRERQAMARPDVPAAPESAQGASPWDAAFNRAATAAAQPAPQAVEAPGGESSGQKTSDRLAPSVKRVPAPAQSPEALWPASGDTAGAPPVPAPATEPAVAAPVSAPPARVASTGGNQSAGNSWLTQQSAAPGAPAQESAVPAAQAKPIPPIPRRRADQLPPIPRGAAVPAANAVVGPQ